MYNILIVDDEAVILEGLKEAIEESTLPFKEVCTAGSALEALQLYEQEPFDILLTDISMPYMDGLKMAEEMKKIWPYVEVIFLTGFSDFEYARGALRLHSFDYLLKPVSDEELTGRLEALIKILDERWLKQFMYDKEEVTCSGQKSRKPSAVLSQQMKRGFTDFEELKNSGFPLDRERRLRLMVFAYQTEQTRIMPDVLHDWITEILQKIAYGYGYVCGFAPDRSHSVFLIQKAADSEALFSGIYKDLEELQGYFYTKLDLNVTIAVSHRSVWERWIVLARQMVLQTGEIERYGAFYTYEESPEESEGKSSGNLLMYKIRDYIMANPGDDLSLGKLAKQFHINPSYLSRSFHQTIQEPLSSYITQVRIREAKRLLRETDDRIYEIAQKVGFETQGYFTKVFSKITGLSPKEYRIDKKQK